MNDDRRIDPKWVLVAAVVAVVAMFNALGDASTALKAASIPIWLGTMAAFAWALRGPLGHAILRFMSPDQGSSGEIEEMRARVADLEAHLARMPEIEERLDFAERLLAQRNEAAGRMGEGNR